MDQNSELDKKIFTLKYSLPMLFLLNNLLVVSSAVALNTTPTRSEWNRNSSPGVRRLCTTVWNNRIRQKISTKFSKQPQIAMCCLHVGNMRGDTVFSIVCYIFVALVSVIISQIIGQLFYRPWWYRFHKMSILNVKVSPIHCMYEFGKYKHRISCRYH